MTTGAAPKTVETAQRTAGEVRSYVSLRMSVGVVAILLPVLAVAVVAFREHEVLPSLSDAYYHRYAVSVFVGAMVAFAAFLFSYEFGTLENWLGNLGALAATLVAVFPTPSDDPDAEAVVGGRIHFGAALSFFLVLAVYCYVWSRDPAQGEPRRSYRVSSVLIVLAVLAAAGIKIVGGPSVAFLLAEVAVVEVFGFSWLLRGGIGVGRAWLATTIATAATAVVALVPDALVSRTLPVALAGVAVLAVPALLWSQRPGARGNRLTPAG